MTYKIQLGPARPWMTCQHANLLISIFLLWKVIQTSLTITSNYQKPEQRISIGNQTKSNSREHSMAHWPLRSTLSLARWKMDEAMQLAVEVRPIPHSSNICTEPTQRIIIDAGSVLTISNQRLPPPTPASHRRTFAPTPAV